MADDDEAATNRPLPPAPRESEDGFRKGIDIVDLTPPPPHDTPPPPPPPPPEE
ncbi:MAG: hypothetical protein QOK28_3888 [Actinomycetota bacterium]|jgi:hypothetical protein